MGAHTGWCRVNGAGRTRVVAQALLLVAFGACAAPQPRFSVDPNTLAAPAAAASRSLYVGHPSTPPPGQYRFVRVYDNGRVESREIYAVNGPGPWLTYEGESEISPESTREIFGIADSTRAARTPGDSRQACVLGTVSAVGAAWRGCADPALAAHVLAVVPALGPPKIDPGCLERVCQFRLIRAVRPLAHDLYGKILQDVVLDASGSFWCATPGDRQGDQPNTMQIVQGRLRGVEPRTLLQWLVDDAAEHLNRSHESSTVQPVSTVQIRGAERAWTPLDASDAATVISRWAQIEPRFPIACQQ